jgi:glucokinase
MTDLLITADIGGTNARLAAYRGEELIRSEQHATGGLQDLIGLFHDFSGALEGIPSMVVAAAAGPVHNNAVRLTNAGKLLCGEELQKATGASQARVINDFAAAAWATASVLPNDINALQGEAHPPNGLRVAVGPGTGLGVGALTWIDGRYHAMPGEGGHVALSPATRFEVDVFEAFKSVWPEVFFGDSLSVEAEAVLSGMGLPFVHRAVQIALGQAPGEPHVATKDIFQLAREGTDPAAIQTIRIFKTHLARMSGDLGLCQWASGGVFIVGGVAAKNPWLFDDEFVAHFNHGGRFTDLRRKMNLYHLTNPDFGLLGARNFALFSLQ